MDLIKRDEESTTAFTIRRITNETIERCADVAQQKGVELGEAAVGRFIADAIRATADH